MTETDIARFTRELTAAHGEDGITDTERAQALTAFTELVAAAAVIDLWRAAAIRVLGYYDDDLIWAVPES